MRQDKTVKLTISFFVNEDGTLSETGQVYVKANKRHGIKHSAVPNVSAHWFKDRYSRYQAIDGVIDYISEQLKS